MLDGIINNRKEWNAKKEEYEAKLKAIEDEKAAKAAAAASKGGIVEGWIMAEDHRLTSLSSCSCRQQPQRRLQDLLRVLRVQRLHRHQHLLLHIWESVRKRRSLTGKKRWHPPRWGGLFGATIASYIMISQESRVHFLLLYFNIGESVWLLYSCEEFFCIFHTCRHHPCSKHAVFVHSCNIKSSLYDI